jgi:hypothetical protein
MTPHLPPDEEEYADDRAIQRLFRQYSQDRNYGNVQVTDNKLMNWLLATLSALSVAGILGDVVMYAKVETIQTTMQLILEGKIVIVQVPKL